MSSQLKETVLSLAHRSGVSQRLARSRWRRDRLLVLCYHGVSFEDEHEWAPSLYVSQEKLNRPLAALREDGCTVLPLEEALDRLRRRDLPERAVVLTFEDGYYNFAMRAQPVLRAYGTPATVYLTTLRCTHNRPVVRLLMSYLLWRNR